jgi:spermidine/putrescine ABC transporter ATP-binding subunit
MSVELKNITKKYGPVTALNNVSLRIEEGEFMTLLGPSGCGKTTLLRIVAGFVQPDAGEILIDDVDISRLKANQRPTGMVFQSYALFPHMNVKDNISFGLKMHKLNHVEIQKRLSKVLELASIEKLKDRYPSQLSGGQQQRVALARTLALEPKVLLLDEPLAALDRKLRIEMRSEVRKIVEKVGITTIFVTHDQEEALTMSDRIAVMNDGVIVQCGSPMDIYDNPKTTFVASFVGNSNLYKGSVRRSSDNKVFFENENLQLPLPNQFVEYAENEVILLVRPEHLMVSRLGPETKDDSSVSGVVTFVTHLGESIEYEVLLDTGAPLKVQIHRSRSQAPLLEGERVLISPTSSDSYYMVQEH